MISIKADEKKQIAEKYPHVYIARTMKQRSKRHRYEMSEEPEAVAYLNELREKALIVTEGG